MSRKTQNNIQNSPKSDSESPQKTNKSNLNTSRRRHSPALDVDQRKKLKSSDNYKGKVRSSTTTQRQAQSVHSGSKAKSKLKELPFKAGSYVKIRNPNLRNRVASMFTYLQQKHKTIVSEYDTKEPKKSGLLFRAPVSCLVSTLKVGLVTKDDEH